MQFCKKVYTFSMKCIYILSEKYIRFQRKVYTFWVKGINVLFGRHNVSWEKIGFDLKIVN